MSRETQPVTLTRAEKYCKRCWVSDFYLSIKAITIAKARATARTETVPPTHFATQSIFFCDEANRKSHSEKRADHFMTCLRWRRGGIYSVEPTSAKLIRTMPTTAQPCPNPNQLVGTAPAFPRDSVAYAPQCLVVAVLRVSRRIGSSHRDQLLRKVLANIPTLESFFVRFARDEFSVN
jgi:hypothetical protein